MVEVNDLLMKAEPQRPDIVATWTLIAEVVIELRSLRKEMAVMRGDLANVRKTFESVVRP